MKKTIQIFAGVLALFALQSCGIITKARYGNGLKLNLGGYSKIEQQKPISKSSKTNLKPDFKPLDAKGNLMPMKTLKDAQMIPLNPPSKLSVKPYGEHPLKLKNIARPIPLSAGQSKFYASTEPPIKTKTIEPHVKIGSIIFYGSILASIVLNFIALPIISSIVTLGLLAGIVLVMVGKRFMKKNPDAFRGYGLMWSVLITCSLFLILLFLNLAFMLALLA